MKYLINPWILQSIEFCDFHRIITELLNYVVDNQQGLNEAVYVMNLQPQRALRQGNWLLSHPYAFQQPLKGETVWHSIISTPGLSCIISEIIITEWSDGVLGQWVAAHWRSDSAHDIESRPYLCPQKYIEILLPLKPKIWLFEDSCIWDAAWPTKLICKKDTLVITNSLGNKLIPVNNQCLQSHKMSTYYIKLFSTPIGPPILPMLLSKLHISPISNTNAPRESKFFTHLFLQNVWCSSPGQTKWLSWMFLKAWTTLSRYPYPSPSAIEMTVVHLIPLPEPAWIKYAVSWYLTSHWGFLTLETKMESPSINEWRC